MNGRSLHLVVAGESELDDVRHVERACFPGGMAYDRRMLRGMLSRVRSVTYLLKEESEPVAYASGFWRRRDATGHVESIAVVPAARGQGLSKVLMDLLHDRFREEGARRVFLEVAVNREEAIGLYERLGYRTVERLEDYYENEVAGSRDAWLMELPLEAGAR